MSKRRGSNATSDSWSVIGNLQKPRIVVVFGNDLFEHSTKVVIPTSPSTTIKELLAEAVRRISSMGIVLPKTELLLRLGDGNGPIAFGEDAIEDVIDSEDKQTTMHVGVLPTAKDCVSNKLIYVRWITAGRALEHSSLSAIPVETTPINNDITVHALEAIAFDRIYGKDMLLRSKIRFRVYLTPCELPTDYTNTATLKDYGCVGTSKQPLNLFLVPIYRNYETSKLQSPWCFEPSDRGVATFITCLKMLMSKAHSDPIVLRRLLKALFNLTHFPPVLEAFHVLATQNNLVSESVVVMSTCFHELALRMVPSNLVQGSASSGLEGSRQIFSWLYSIYRRALNEPDIASTALVRRVQLECLDNGAETKFLQQGDRNEIIELEIFNLATQASTETSAPDNHEYLKDSATTEFDDEIPKSPEDDSSTPSSALTIQLKAGTNPATTHRVMVCTNATCQEDLSLLARAFWGRYDAVTNYYIDFRNSVDKPLEQNHRMLLSPADFGQLLMETNNCEHFQMFSPQELHGKTSTVITMSKGGYVSLYNIEDVPCAGTRHSIENYIEGTRTTNTDPGNEIMTALEPTITRRKTDGTWVIDDWALARQVKIDGESPNEAIVICFDLSYSMDSPLGENWIGDGSENTFCRIDEAKQVFRNVVARIGNSNVHIGLVTFASREQVRMRAPLSTVGNLFKGELELAMSQGSTALWDALMRAETLLKAHKSKHPATKLRIIVLTDGEDNDSKRSPADVCQKLYDAEIVLDALVIGTHRTEDLFRIAKHTGGYAFCPSSRQLLFQTFLLEPFLDISARPEIERIPIDDYWMSAPKKPDMTSMYDFPPCRPHPLQDGSFISLSDISRFFARNSTSLLENARAPSINEPMAYRALDTTSSLNNNTIQNQSNSTAINYRSDRSGVSFGKLYLDEMKLMMANPNRFMDVYVKEADMSFWKVVMNGPPDSPYKDGTFIIYVHLTDSFPQKAPDVRFITPILHPNITKHGRICHGILSKGWNPNFHIHDVMQDIVGLLATAEPGDAIDEMAALKFWTDIPAAQAEIVKYVDKFAKRSRAEWKTEIINS